VFVVKPGFHQIQDEPVEVPMYFEDGGRQYVRQHQPSEDEYRAIDRALFKNNMAQTREWDEHMLKNSDYNDYIQDTPSQYPAPRDSVLRLPPAQWERYTFKDEKAAQDAEIAKRAAEYANYPLAAVQVRSDNDDYHIADNIQSS
jgi:hypothetical protein